MTDVIEYIKNKWTTEDPSVIAKQIGQGQSLPTQALAFSKDVEYRNKVVQAGGIDRILEFLLKTDTPFDQIKQGGDLSCPSIWLCVLSKFCHDAFFKPEGMAKQVKYKIIVNMGPLFQDMSNLEKRELFGSREYWIKSLAFFTSILAGLLQSDFEKLGDFLVRQASLKEFLVRVLFLEIGDPEIKDEILEYMQQDDNTITKPDILGLSQTNCAFCIKALMTKRAGPIIEEYAITPIRPEHQMTMKSGIVQLLETNNRKGWYQGGYSSTLAIFLILYDRYERLSSEFGVDSASVKMVDFCRTHLDRYAHDKRDNHFFENVMMGIVTLGATMMTPAVNQQQAPIDHNIANAIRHGLFDFCLDVCDSNDVRLTTAMDGLLKLLDESTATLVETKKAVEETAVATTARLERVMTRMPCLYTGLNILKNILNQAMPNKALDGAKVCEFCFEPCTKGTTTKCPFCRTVTYCSKDCQRLNWMLHQNTCLEVRKTPLPKTSEEIISTGKIIFSKHVTKILFQASLKNISVLDVIVVLDLCESTPLFQTLTLEQFSDLYIQDEEATSTAKKIFDKNKMLGCLTVCFVGFTEDGMDAPLLSFPPDTVPHTHLVKDVEDTKKWEASQLVVAQGFTQNGDVKMIRDHPRLLKAAILKTMKP